MDNTRVVNTLLNLDTKKKEKSPPQPATLCDMMQVWASPKPPASYWISQPRGSRCESQMITDGYSYD